MLVSVALPVPLYQQFDYLLPRNRCDNQSSEQQPSSEPTQQLQVKHPPQTLHQKSLPAIGSRVRVPFGRQTLIGIVVGYTDPSTININPNQLKSIKQVLDDEAIIDDELLQLAQWLANYYHYPLGEVFMVMLPAFIRQGKALDIFVHHWRVCDHANIDDLAKSAYKQREQFALIQLNGEQGASEDVLLLEGVERHYLKKLADKGLIESFQQRRDPAKAVSLAKLPLTLNEEQQIAVDAIAQAHKKSLDNQHGYQGFLLNGVTGSGKTEVYLQAMQPVLEAKQQVLILVPEIGLTPQTKARFSQRFVANILLLHSGLSDSARMQGWEDCQQGHAQIIIGTRSALLYPFANLGLIIVDEAHDSSYKQQDSLRYHASDVALYRGFQLGIPVVLGTATPTLEQLKLVTDAKLTQLMLSRRAGYAKPPILQLLDARHPDGEHTRTIHSQQTDGKWQDTGLTTEVIKAIGQTLEAGEQVLVFLNRRGYAPVLLCHACGWQADCPHCDAHLTVHKPSQADQSSFTISSYLTHYLQCHHCGWRIKIPHQCPECHSSNLDTLGMGTSQLTNGLHAIFANPQKSKKNYPIIQIDRDTTRNKGSWENIYRQINTGKPAILVGTQMIAKGHHFPKVTLVVMPNADQGFLSSDFRSPEHTAQLIMQVAGRAGRSEKAGRVLIQTLQPDNPLLLSLVAEGYQPFASQLMHERYVMGLPPFVYACLIRCEGKTSEKTHIMLNEVSGLLNQYNQQYQQQVAISAVVDAPLAKKNGRYHSQLLLLARKRSQLHNLLDSCWLYITKLPSAKGMRLSLDIDPIGW